MHGARYQDATGRRLGLEARGDVHAVAEQIVVLDDQVAEMQPHAEQDGAILGLGAGLLANRLLQLDGGGERVDGAGELHQHAVAGQLDDAAAALGQQRHELLLADGAQPGDGAALIPAHQPGVADHIGSQDRRQSPLLTGQSVPSNAAKRDLR